MINETKHGKNTRFMIIDPYSDTAENKLLRYTKVLNKIMANNAS